MMTALRKWLGLNGSTKPYMPDDPVRQPLEDAIQRSDTARRNALVSAVDQLRDTQSVNNVIKATLAQVEGRKR